MAEDLLPGDAPGRRGPGPRHGDTQDLIRRFLTAGTKKPAESLRDDRHQQVSDARTQRPGGPGEMAQAAQGPGARSQPGRKPAPGGDRPPGPGSVAGLVEELDKRRDDDVAIAEV
jgi:hypothetical protein